MARTKQTARKSTGGRAPRKQLRLGSEDTDLPIFRDHEYNLVKLATGGAWRELGLGFFPFQVYILERASQLAGDQDFPDRLRQYIRSNDTTRFNENVRFHLQIYTDPKKDVLECIAHHEREKRYRKCQGRGPEMLNRKEFMVFDSSEWECGGVTTVTYTAEFLGHDSTERNLENHVDDYCHNFPAAEDEPEVPLQGLRRDLIVKREEDPNSLVERFLHAIYIDEGHEWRMPDLVQRNVAMGWPHDVRSLDWDEPRYSEPIPIRSLITRGWLPTEQRPRGEYDDDDEVDDDEEYLAREIFKREAILTFGEECDPVTRIPWSLRPPPYPGLVYHRQSEAQKPPPPPPPSSRAVDFDNFFSVEAIDCLGRACLDVHHASSAAIFSYSIYVLGETSLEPRDLFPLLNLGLLAKTPWCLHVYRLSCLSEALSHSAAEMEKRPDASPRRPSDYSGPEQQTQKHVFLAIGGDRPLEEGPWIITTNGGSRAAGVVLDMQKTGNWSNASQILFAYQLHCGETPALVAPLCPTSAPHLEVSISVPKECSTLRESSDTWESTRSETLCPLILRITLSPSTPAPITLSHRFTICDPHSFQPHLRIIDASTNEEVPLANLKQLGYVSELRGIDQLYRFGFMERELRGGVRSMMTLWPGQSVERKVAWVNSRVYDRHRGVVKVGARYRLMLREGTTVRKWVWGALEEEGGDAEIIGTGSVGDGRMEDGGLVDESFLIKKGDPDVLAKNLKGPFGLAPLEVRAVDEPFFALVGEQDAEGFPATQYGRIG